MPFTPEQADRICQMIAGEGLTLRQVAEREGISDSLIIWNKNHDEEFAKQYVRAMETRTEKDFEGLEELAFEEPERGIYGVDSAWVNWKRLQVDTRKWILSKRVPKTYGDKLAVGGTDGGALEVVIKHIGSDGE